MLNSDDASNIALEFNLNPIIDMEKGFDIYPEYVSNSYVADFADQRMASRSTHCVHLCT